MAGGAFKKLTLVTLLTTILGLTLWVLLRRQSQKPEQTQEYTEKLGKWTKGFLALWIVCLVSTILSTVLWFKHRVPAANAATNS